MMSTKVFAVLTFLAVLAFVCHTNASRKQDYSYCNRKCLRLVNRLMQLKEQNLEDYSLWSKAGSHLKSFCRRARLPNRKCTEFFGYALQNAGSGQSSWSICQASDVCRPKMKKSKLDQPKEKPAEKKQSGCKVCEVLKNALKSVDINKQAQVWESISVEVCKDKKVEGIEAACKFLERRHKTPDAILSTILGLGGASCEKFLCNKATSEVFKFMPKSAGSCKLCHQVLNITLASLKGSEKILDTVLSDVNAVCMTIKNETLKAACKESIDKTKGIYDYVMKKLELTTLCEDLELCPGNKEDEPFFQVAKSLLTAKSDSCEACKPIESIGKEGMANLNSNVSMIKGYLDEACENVEDENLKKKCALARPILSVASTSNLLKRENCAALMCNGATQVLKSLFPASEKGCQICKETLKIMGDSKEQTVVLVKRILYDVGEICSSLSTPEGRKACYYSTNETLKIFSYVLSKLDVSNICTDFGFCTKNMKTNPLNLTLSSVGRFLAEVASDKPSQSKSCGICDTVGRSVKVVTAMVGTHLSRLQTIEGSCKVNSSSTKCVRWQGVHARFEKMQRSKHIENICQRFGCNSFISRLLPKIPRGDKTCSICKLSLKITLDGIKQGIAFANQIIDEAGSLCTDYKTEAAQEKCRSVIAETKVILEYVVKKLDLSNLCEVLDLCPKAAVKNYKAGQKSSSSASCPVCDSVNRIGQERLGKMQVSVSKLSEQISQACKNDRSPKVQHKCVGVLPAVRYIQAIRFPSKLCDQFVCSSSKDLSFHGDAKSCATCKKVMKVVIDGMKSAENMVSTILEECDSLCDSLESEQARETCHFSLKETRKGLEILFKALEPTTLCKDIGFCATWQKSAMKYVSKITKMLGGKNMCSTCKTMLDGLKSQNMKTSTLIQMCDRLGGKTISSVCTDLSKNYKKLAADPRLQTVSGALCTRLPVCTRRAETSQAFDTLRGLFSGFSKYFSG